MKKRRTLIISLLLVAALALGVGYATLSRELLITSSANLEPDQADFNIIFTDAISSDEDVATASVTSNATTANYTISGLSKVGDKVTLTFKITNQTTDVSAKLSGVTHIAGNLSVGGNTAVIDEYFTKVTTIVDGENNTYSDAEDFILSPGETATVTVTVTLKQTVTSAMALTGASIKLDFVNA